MTNKLRLILFIILGLILTAMASRNAALVWMALPFLLYILTGLLSIPRGICLSAHRIISHHWCKAGTLITMTLVVENNGGNIPSLLVHESINPQIHVINKSGEKWVDLPSQGKIEIIYTFQAPRGKYYWEKIQISVSDSLCLFEQKIELPAEGEVVVLPDEMNEKQFKLNPKCTLTSPGLYQSNQPGSGANFLGVREYNPGDPLRSIYWRLSARHPKQLFSKEFEREEMADVGLIVDGSATMNIKFGKEELFDSSVQLASIIARSIIRGGNRLSLLVLGDRVLRVFPGTGKQQLARVLNQLAACKPGENVTLNTINYLPVKLFPSNALIILISPLSERDIPAITRLLANGYQVSLISPDPVKFVSRPSSHPLAVRTATLERTALLWKIRKMGVEVHDWPMVNSGLFFLENDDRKTDFKPRLKQNHQGTEFFDRWWLMAMVPILLICATTVGILIGLSQEVMIAGTVLAMVIKEIMEVSWSRYDRIDLTTLNKHTWTQIKPVVLSMGIGLMLSIVGLQIQLSLAFGIVVLAVLLLLFSLNRFYLLLLG
ncbi:MAG: DUF58 domain-containing protein [Anaerolineaceae bacterium]|nr:DUF58 domain-containing protein [Anaerolineaceae bacterium]